MVTSPQRHSAEFTFGTCYGPPRKSPSVTSPVTSPTQKSAPGMTSPTQKTPTPTGGLTSPTQRFQQGVLSPTQAAIQVCFIYPFTYIQTVPLNKISGVPKAKHTM